MWFEKKKTVLDYQLFVEDRHLFSGEEERRKKDNPQLKFEQFILSHPNFIYMDRV